jgi:uncharacterized protein YndB with AHSA1/START domain
MTELVSEKKSPSMAGTIVKTFEIDAPPERVYKAFTTKKDLQEWKFDHYQIDGRKGGRFKMGREEDGYVVTGEFLELVPNEKLVYTWRMNDYDKGSLKPIPNWSDENPSKVTVKFEKAKKGTKITLVHEGFPQKDEEYYMHEVGWDLLVGEVLKHYLESSKEEFYKWWARVEPNWEERWQKKAKEVTHS